MLLLVCRRNRAGSTLSDQGGGELVSVESGYARYEIRDRREFLIDGPGRGIRKRLEWL